MREGGEGDEIVVRVRLDEQLGQRVKDSALPPYTSLGLPRSPTRAYARRSNPISASASASAVTAISSLLSKVELIVVVGWCWMI